MRSRHAAALAALVVLASVVSGAVAERPAAGQEIAGPLITDLTATTEYTLDPCCFTLIYLNWNVDPSGPVPDRYEVDYRQAGGHEANSLPGSATSDVAYYLVPDRDTEITLRACSGPTDTEVCNDFVTNIRTAAAIEPFVRVTSVSVTATSSDRIQITWTGESNLPTSYVALNVSSSDPPTNHTTLVNQNPVTWGGVQPGATYVVSIRICGGPTPSSQRCGSRSATYTVPQPTGVLSGTIYDWLGRAQSGASVMAYAPMDGLLPTVRVTTGADGSYSFYGLAEGQYAIVAVSQGAGPEWFGGVSRESAVLQTVAEGSIVDGLDVTLTSSTWISGVITDDGIPVAGAIVWGYADGDTWLGSVVGTTRSDGSYSLSGAKPGRYKIAVMRPGEFALAAWFGGANRSEAQWVDVAGTPVRLIDVDLSP